MRFQRADLPGMAIAVLGGPALMILFLASFELWHHQGTPLLGGLAQNVAVPAGLIGAFSRFIKKWDPVVLLIGIILLLVVGVNVAQRTDMDHTLISTLMKLGGVLVFMILNLVIVLQFVIYGLLPILDRRDARKAAEREAAAA